MTNPYVYEYRIRRVRRSTAAEVSIIDGSNAAAAAFWPFVRGLAQETFLVALLDVRNKLLGIERVFTGTLTGVDVHPREIFRAAILAGAAAIVVAHNHPSGNTAPSVADRALTERLRKAGDLLGIPVLDHVILSSDDPSVFTSLADME